MSSEGQQEPSMEDILASIRKILSEDEESGGEAPEAKAAPTSEPEPEAVPELGLLDEFLFLRNQYQLH